jgi:hypothetical protein
MMRRRELDVCGCVKGKKMGLRGDTGAITE